MYQIQFSFRFNFSVKSFDVSLYISFNGAWVFKPSLMFFNHMGSKDNFLWKCFLFFTKYRIAHFHKYNPHILLRNSEGITLTLVLWILFQLLLWNASKIIIIDAVQCLTICFTGYKFTTCKFASLFSIVTLTDCKIDIVFNSDVSKRSLKSCFIQCLQEAGYVIL